MDQKLAELYGTNQPEGDDVEKLAAAQLAEELGGGEVDTATLSDEDVENLAAEVLAAEGGGEVAPAGDPQEEAQEKLAEADYLGRVMAHAYVQELRGIEKEAGVKEMGGKVLAKLKGVGGKAKELAGKAGTKAKEMGGKAKLHVGAHRAAYAGGAGVAGGAAAGYMAGKHKKSSALDTLAERRAIEICEANGIDPSTLEVVETAPEQTKTSAPAAEALDQAVTQRAAEMLATFGIELTQEE